MRHPFAVALLGAALATSGCPKKAPPSAEAGASDAPGDAAIREAEAAPSPEDLRIEELWSRAKDGEADDLARLADREGTLGLEEGGTDPAHRLTALRAAGFAGDLTALPWLADVATSGTDEEAVVALASAAELAAAPRRSVDPEDALELRAGCDALLGLAKEPTKPKPRRIGAIRVLRMLSDRGCAKAADVPTDLDTH
jgi:hypothetical protein